MLIFLSINRFIVYECKSIWCNSKISTSWHDDWVECWLILLYICIHVGINKDTRLYNWHSIGDHPFDPYIALLKTFGILVVVGAANEIKPSPASLFFGITYICTYCSLFQFFWFGAGLKTNVMFSLCTPSVQWFAYLLVWANMHI